MNEIHVQSLKHRARIHGEATPQVRERIAQALAHLLDEGLDSALVHAGVDGDEEICIKRFVTRAHLDFARSDGQLVADWSVAWIDALREVLRNGGDNVIRYRARVHVLVDMATRILRRDGARAWAWQQLGVWSGTPVDSPAAGIELARVLSRNDSSVLPVCLVLAGERLLGSWLAQLPATSLRALSDAALRAAHVPAIQDQPAAHSSGHAEPASRVAVLARILSASPLSAELLPIATSGNSVHLAALAVLAADPTALRCDETATALREAVRQWLVHGPVKHELNPQCARERPESGNVACVSETRVSTHPLPDAVDNGSARAAGHRIAHARPRGQHSENDRPRVNVDRTAVHTEFGGLIYLLWLVECCGVIDAASTGPLSSRGLRWTLRQIALQLLPLAPDDPVLDAFTGLPPRDKEDEHDPPTPAEVADIAVLASRLAEQLRERLGGPMPRESLLDTVCRRAAAISFEPGWIELHFKLDMASTAIRRAGLDRDLGWVPWLGTVVRFAYV